MPIQINVILKNNFVPLPTSKMSKCIKCKQTGRFFDKNGLDFWYFVDLFRTISRAHE